MKSFFFSVSAIFSIFILAVHCNGKTGGRVAPPAHTTPYPTGSIPQAGAPHLAKGFVWYGDFTVGISKEYEELLKVCNRCGILKTSPGGNFKFNLTLFDSPSRCKNWLRDGGFQIEFAALKLPTEVTVTLQPHYRGGSTGCWGHPFTVKGVATATNESKGFEILLTPNNGLQGSRNLKIKSEHSNHVKDHTLDVMVFYQQGGGNVSSPHSALFTSNMIKQNPPGKRAIMDIRSVCRQYAQNDCVSGAY